MDKDGTLNLWSECVIEQYTGLKDEDGKEIHEGDILSNGDRKVVVQWDKECGRFIGFKEPYRILGHKFKMWEVMGNIHQNPELL